MEKWRPVRNINRLRNIW